MTWVLSAMGVKYRPDSGQEWSTMHQGIEEQMRSIIPYWHDKEGAKQQFLSLSASEELLHPVYLPYSRKFLPVASDTLTGLTGTWFRAPRKCACILMAFENWNQRRASFDRPQDIEEVRHEQTQSRSIHVLRPSQVAALSRHLLQTSRRIASWWNREHQRFRITTSSTCVS